MAQINEAWRVLSDPARRAVYDAAARGSAAGSASSNGSARSSATGASATGSAYASPGTTATGLRHSSIVPPPATPARFPWRFMLVIAALGIAFVLVNAALTEPSMPPAPDRVLAPGSCVDFADNGDAVEVTCDGTNDGVVVKFQGEDGICPQGTEEHRDRQGMGPVCIRLGVFAD